MTPEEVRKIIHEELASLLKTDRYTFERLVQVMDGRNIQFGITTGTKIGTAANQKLSFFGKIPVVQQSLSIIGGGGAASDGTARDKIDTLIGKLQTLGLFT